MKFMFSLVALFFAFGFVNESEAASCTAQMKNRNGKTITTLQVDHTIRTTLVGKPSGNVVKQLEKAIDHLLTVLSQTWRWMGQQTCNKNL